MSAKTEAADKGADVPEVQAHFLGLAKYDSSGGDIFALDRRPPGKENKGAYSNAMEFEDDFKGVYGLGKLQDGVALIEPPYNLSQLEGLCDRNNAMRPCIDAMITNVDGTGWVIEKADAARKAKDEQKKALNDNLLPVEKSEDSDMDDPIVQALVGFFREPWPGMSFTTIRKKLRRDLERTGNAYLEIVRSLSGEMVYVRQVESKTMRLVILDDGFWAPVKLIRNGNPVEVVTHVRRRRYVQKINTTYTYFREYGAERALNRKTGVWAKEGETFKPEDTASEIIHFVVDQDANTPYGVPRWVNQIPSILGSRAAEEYNLSYFGSGGVPPALITVHGGTLATKTKEALEAFMTSDPKTKTRACVVEVVGGAGGSISDTQKVEVKVHEFGQAMAKDSMFEGYDDKCEKRIRKSWRLPPLFVGMSQDYSYASAYASYVVAEAQVFKPERDEFDEIISLKLIRELSGGNDYVFRSLGLTVSDVAEQMKAVQAARDAGAITVEEYVKSTNQLLGLDLVVDPLAVEADKASFTQKIPDPEDKDLDKEVKRLGVRRAEAEITNLERGGSIDPMDAKRPVAKTEGPFPWSHNYVISLAEDLADLVAKGDTGVAYRRAIGDVGELNPEELTLFKSVFSERSLGAQLVSDSTGDLMVAAAGVTAADPEPEHA